MSILLSVYLTGLLLSTILGLFNIYTDPGTHIKLKLGIKLADVIATFAAMLMMAATWPLWLLVGLLSKLGERQ